MLIDFRVWIGRFGDVWQGKVDEEGGHRGILIYVAPSERIYGDQCTVMRGTFQVAAPLTIKAKEGIGSIEASDEGHGAPVEGSGRIRE